MGWVGLSLAALASDPAPSGAAPEPMVEAPRPLAIPADTPAPQGLPGRERASALRTYARKHLAVHSLAEVYATPATTTWWGGRWGGFATTTPGYLVASDTWAVFEGEHRLDVPSYLHLVGDDASKERLDHRISAHRSAGTALAVVGVAGLTATFAGLVGMEVANTLAAQRQWSAISLGGLGAGVGGLVIGSFPATRARRLATYPDRTLDRRQVEEAVEAYDVRLATELGLSPEQALRVEQRERGEPR